MIRGWLGRLGRGLGETPSVPLLLSRGAVVRLSVVAVIGLGLFLAFGLAHVEPVAKRADIGVIHPWSRGAARAGEQYPIYASFENGGRVRDRLISIETPLAQEAVMKELDTSSGIVRPRELDELDIPGNSKVSFRPGARQITLVGLRQAVEPGTAIPVTFVFERAGRVRTQIQVENLGQPDHADHASAGSGGAINGAS
ncbi:MAG: copper chaperone PCu(A)C [Bosea sp.]|uniref:copper chaperone PCu(A)C n=1 Tax=Bosea sp. (in: a-proteobacteria) TaxID=1871050 RepID=UPI00238F10B2|nr:copper chaperone PCu(A)C [Bosea sp. (in: a-proteobacteria)]MCP4735770.1 copper chaperone PCu(A)C [Bosea sp. (in: a-proteobacteria)]